ncbi:MAG: mercuric transporter MerT family protein [Candidatus Latescibacterota bacterium]
MTQSMDTETRDAPLATAETTRKWSLAATFGAIATAFVASLCCVGPLVLALLGLGGAGLLVKLEPYRPYFTTVTVALLAAGFYVAYRKPTKVVSAPAGGAACACPAARAYRTGRRTLWVATVLVAAFLAFPPLAAVLFG